MSPVAKWKYWFHSHGRLGNRPLEEIRREANLTMAAQVLGCEEVRYVDNAANRYLGYCDGERAVLLESITAQSVEQLRLAWRIEMILAQADRQLATLHKDTQDAIHAVL